MGYPVVRLSLQQRINCPDPITPAAETPAINDQNAIGIPTKFKGRAAMTNAVIASYFMGPRNVFSPGL
jgi:hypothetical protein